MVFGLLAGAAVAAFGALVLGESPVTERTALLAGPLFGLAVGEGVLAGAGTPARNLAVPAAVLAAGGLMWGVWISAGRDWSYVGWAAWGAVALGMVVASCWVLRSSGPRAAGSPPSR